jgi:hypothetical protein
MDPMAESAVAAQMTQEEALRQAAALVDKALKETEARCGVMAKFINDCAATNSKALTSTDAFIELRALHGYRIRLMRRQRLIQDALDCPVGEPPAPVPLSAPPPDQAARGTQQQVQVQARPRRR